MTRNIRAIAFYLPQYHPIPENDQWWGKGFTEWTNVGKAKKYFPGHYQPRVPADLGYYDLRVPETRMAQAALAKKYGIEGFAYWHYWFGKGKRLLERPLNEVLQTGQPEYPFCVSWANESWKGFDHGLMNRKVLIEQLYPGSDDYEAHFYEILPALLDKRYIKVHEKPLFFVLQPLSLPDPKSFIEQWQNLAIKNGLKGIYFVGQSIYPGDFHKIVDESFDAVNLIRLNDFLINGRKIATQLFDALSNKLFGIPNTYYYKDAIKYLSGIEDAYNNCIPTILSGWDHSPRSGKEGLILRNYSPELFYKHVATVVEKIKHKPVEDRIVFVKSWNEWAEGNYLEPDQRYGAAFLEAFSSALKNISL